MKLQVQAKALTLSCFILGLGLLVAGGVFVVRTRNFISQSVTAQGRVIDLDYRSGTGPRSASGYVSVFTFSDVTGHEHTNRTGSAENPFPHRVGDAVTVLYLPDDPQAVRIRAFGNLWAVPAFVGGFGAAFTTVGLLGFIAARKMDAPEEGLLSKLRTE